MKLIDKISSSIISAMKEKNVDELESLRAIKSALLLAQTQKGSDGNIQESDEIKILQKLVKQRKESAEIYKKQSRLELANIEINQSRIIERFLPDQISKEDLDKLITEIINQTGAQGMKDMGKVMGITSIKLSGKADGKTISNIVRSKLI
ncbi:GatB/YqeY domain-containing protein [Flavobacteriaceae bacterium]|nr:GatB/YqeY domain-containing protein [Flavobacteriaceae bacterium]MDC0355412.1 GatB/YqeY domain-containing protein [Flavobacteriaceae bacterium]